jgi:hypothetical protein
MGECLNEERNYVVYWNHLANDSILWRSLVNMLIHVCVSQKLAGFGE